MRFIRFLDIWFWKICLVLAVEILKVGWVLFIYLVKVSVSTQSKALAVYVQGGILRHWSISVVNIFSIEMKLLWNLCKTEWCLSSFATYWMRCELRFHLLYEWSSSSVIKFTSCHIMLYRCLFHSGIRVWKYSFLSL